MSRLVVVRSGRFSGSAPRLIEALQAHVDVIDIDLMPESKDPSFLPFRVAALLEARRHGRRTPPRLTASWSVGMERLLHRKLDPSDKEPVLFVQSLHAFRMSRPYWIYTDRVGLEGASATTNHRTHYSTRWLERERTFLRNAERVLTMGSSTCEFLASEYDLASDSYDIVGAGVNARPAQRRVRRECNRLLFVGTQFDLKGGSEMLKAFSEVRKENQDLTLTIAGTISQRDTPPGVTYVGVRTLAEMTSLYESADAFVVPSKMEAYGIALTEALISGLPVIGTTVGNQASLIRDAGLVVSPGITHALVDAMSTLIKMYPDFEARARRRGEQLEQSNSWDRVAATILSFCTGDWLPEPPAPF